MICKDGAAHNRLPLKFIPKHKHKVSFRLYYRYFGYSCVGSSWWRHPMEIFSACAGNSPFTVTKASDAELWCFLWSAPEQTVYNTIFYTLRQSQWVNSVPPYARKLHFMYEVVRTSSKCRWNIYRTSSKCRWSIYRTSRKRRGTLRVVHKVERSSPTVAMPNLKYIWGKSYQAVIGSDSTWFNTRSAARFREISWVIFDNVNWSTKVRRGNWNLEKRGRKRA